MNGDGIADLISLSGTTVSIHLGIGSGTFQPAITYTFSGSPLTSVALVDVNNDGKLDLVLGAQYNYSLTILLGDGTGHFATTSQVLGVESPDYITVADLNGDGNPDFITGDLAAGSINVMLSNGNGTFRSPVGYSSGGGYPLNIAVADFNHDGSVDLAVSSIGGTISILLGNGDGTFQTETNLPSSANGGKLITGSLRGNGTIDLVATTNGGAAFQVYLGNNDGTFAAPVTHTTSYAASDASLVDINHDGRLDLVHSPTDRATWDR